MRNYCSGKNRHPCLGPQITSTAKRQKLTAGEQASVGRLHFRTPMSEALDVLSFFSRITCTVKSSERLSDYLPSPAGATHRLALRLQIRILPPLGPMANLLAVQYQRLGAPKLRTSLFCC